MKGKYKRKDKGKDTPQGGHHSAMNTGEKQEHAAKEKCKAETNDNKKPMNNVSKWWHEPAHVIQAVGIGIGIVVMLIYVGQLCQMIKSNKIMREQFSAENRPWLTFEVIRQPDAKGVVTVLMKNGGKTPATHVTDIGARTRVVTGKKEIDEFWNGWKNEIFHPREHPTMVVSPTASAQTMSTPDGDYAPTGPNSDQILIVYGRVDYSGAYAREEKYWTEFCFEYITKIPTASPWAPCIDHNEMH